MKILITGASGQLGTEIQRQLKNGGSALGPVPERLKNATVIATDVAELDITDRDATIAFVRRHQPDTIISCAAFTNVDGCETNPEAAFKVNAIGASNLAQAAERINARLIHVSTDYVFRGEGDKPLDESERVDPKSVYGKTKALGEEYVKNFCHRYFIVRTAWLYGYAGKNFVKTIVNAGKKFGRLEVVSDQLGNPTNAEDLAHHILQLAVSHDYGVYHCTGEGVCSWYEFASEIIRLSAWMPPWPPAPARNIPPSTPPPPTAPHGARWKTGCWPAPWATTCGTGKKLWPISSPTGTANN